MRSCTGSLAARCTGPAFKPLLRTFRDAIGDLKIEVVRMISQADMVAAHYHVTGRHSGPALGGDPTQQPVDFWGMAMIRVEDGRIGQAWNCVEMLAMYQQIGWVTIPPVL
jgi:predicted ester cyclase